MSPRKVGEKGLDGRAMARLRVLDDIIRLGPEAQALSREISAHDKELADQIRRAWVRAGMNAGEAQFRRGAKGKSRFDDAMGEAREAMTGLQMATAFGFIQEARSGPLLKEVDRVVGCLWVLANRRKRAG